MTTASDDLLVRKIGSFLRRRGDAPEAWASFSCRAGAASAAASAAEID